MNRLYMMLLQNICAEFFVLLLSLSCVPMLVKIFLPGGKSAADVAFLFIHVKNFADALRQGRVDLLQAVGAVFMYRALANPKLLRGLTHSGFMFDDIICDFYCPLLNVIFHKNNPCINCFLQSMRGDFDVCLHFPFERRGSPAKKSHSPSPMAYYTFILYHIFSRNKFFTIYTWAF